MCKELKDYTALIGEPIDSVNVKGYRAFVVDGKEFLFRNSDDVLDAAQRALTHKRGDTVDALKTRLAEALERDKL